MLYIHEGQKVNPLQQNPMYYEQLTELTYTEFINAVANAKAKQKLRCSLTGEERYLLEHVTSIECAILSKDDTCSAEDLHAPVAQATRARGLSDDIEDSSLSSYFAWRGVTSDRCPSSRW